MFAGVEGGEGTEHIRRKGRAGLTHDALVASASEDVTAALRRTHQLMQTELSRSQFAQDTLGLIPPSLNLFRKEVYVDRSAPEQSTAALSSLSESYSTLDTLLASSRSLAASLLRSQKSDTWYLETAFYLLIGTIVWLVFRRILYGPLWWMLWMPLKLMARIIVPIFAGMGLANSPKSTQLSGSLTSMSLGNSGTSLLSGTPPTVISGVTSKSTAEPSSLSSVHDQETGIPHVENESIVDEIENIVQKENDNSEKGTNVDDISPEERRRQEQLPRNPKKRMHEETIMDEQRKDEL